MARSGLDAAKPVAVVQARMGSSRLPGKVLMEAAGKPFLAHLVERLRASRRLGGIIIATSTNQADAAIARVAEELGVAVVRGDERDVLSRYALAAEAFGLAHIVRITADCPLVDPSIVDLVVARYVDSDSGYDYVSNMHPPTFPDGLDVEVFSGKVLYEASREAGKPHEREHVTPFIWDQPNRYRIGNVAQGTEMHLTHRWTLDYPEDREFLTKVIDHLYRPASPFGMAEILRLLEERPEIAEINRQYAGTNWWAGSWEQLRTRDSLRTRRGLRQ